MHVDAGSWWGIAISTSKQQHKVWGMLCTYWTVVGGWALTWDATEHCSVLVNAGSWVEFAIG